MSLSAAFHKESASLPPAKTRLAPFSLRLSANERTRLVAEAGRQPLGSYIKSRLLDGAAPIRSRGPTIKDRESFAKALALLGRSHLANNLNQLAKAVNTGSLPLTPETEAELLEAIRAVKELRILLMRALGMKSEGLQ